MANTSVFSPEFKGSNPLNWVKNNDMDDLLMILFVDWLNLQWSVKITVECMELLNKG